MNRNKLKIIAIIIPIVAAAGFLFLKYNLDMFLGFLPPFCVFYETTGIQCPACGNTRSVMAILRGDIFAALNFNPAVPFLLLALILVYIELCTAAFGKKRLYLLPRTPIFWVPFWIILFSYYIVRNII